MSENSRVEGILQATIDGNEYTDIPQSRVEELLIELKEVIEEGGGGGGTTVVPNPSGTATADLKKVKIGSDIFEIPEPTPNPAGEAIEELKKIQIGSDIFSIPKDDIFAPTIYSLEEREVGVWVDDKPLYRRTFDKRSLYLSDNAWSNNILGTTGIHIVNYEGYFSLGADEEPTIPYSYYRSSTEYFTSTIDTSYSDINVRPNMNYGAIYAGIVTIWYTKDSDVAGSGSYGSLGVPMVHYDNTEKVVGTYFGKTLYEKSYQNVAGSGQSVNVTLSDLTDIETIFIVPEASASTDDMPFPYVHYSTSNIIGGFFTISNGVPTLCIRRGSDMARVNVGLKYLTVRYTKTTD